MSSKQRITINLNSDVVEKLDAFRKENGISNRSAAAERLLLKALTDNCVDEKSIENIVLKIIEEKGFIQKNQKPVEEKEEMDDLDKAAMSSLNELT